MLTLLAFVVVSHLQTSSPKTTLDVEALVRLAAVENALVAADLLSNEVECLDQAQAKLLALLVLGNRNILDVTDLSKFMDTTKREVLAHHS